MDYLLFAVIGYLLYPFINVGIKLFRNAWIEYKKQTDAE